MSHPIALLLAPVSVALVALSLLGAPGVAPVARAGGEPAAVDPPRQIHGDLVEALADARARVAKARAGGSREALVAALRHLADIHEVREERIAARAVRAEAREVAAGTGPIEARE